MSRESNEYQYAWRKKNPEKVKASAKRWRDKLRREVLTHYSQTDIPECECCGEQELVFLTLDHVNGDGAESRRAVGSKGGTDYYAWVRRNGYPVGYRILCWNCNAAYGTTGECPHQG